MIYCSRRIEFDAGHRVIGHNNKCQFLHGHRYTLEVTLASTKLNNLGMVIDFGTIKEVIKGWIDKNLDHTMILSKEDSSLGDNITAITTQRIYYIDQNPTAENIALHLKHEVIPKLLENHEAYLVKLRLFETPNCFVEV